jgi:hypothetical protein
MGEWRTNNEAKKSWLGTNLVFIDLGKDVVPDLLDLGRDHVVWDVAKVVVVRIIRT